MKWTKAEMAAWTPNHRNAVLMIQGEVSEDDRWFVAKMDDYARLGWGVSCPATGARIVNLDRKWHARAFCVEMGRRLDARKPQTVYDYVCAELSASRMSTISRKAAELNAVGIADALREYDTHRFHCAPAPAWLTR